MFKKDGKEKTPVELYNSGSILCEGLTFKNGNLEGSGKITINCCFVGNIYTNDEVVIEEVGAISGNIEAKSIIIKGDVEGNVDAMESVKLFDGGVLNGDIRCATLEISNGAAFSGNCNMTSGRKSDNMLHRGGQEDNSIIPIKSKTEEMI